MPRHQLYIIKTDRLDDIVTTNVCTVQNIYFNAQVLNVVCVCISYYVIIVMDLVSCFYICIAKWS